MERKENNMTVKNIVFSGFMAMVLAGACGAANAEIIVASQKYVDTKLGSVNTELSEKITALENANKDLMLNFEFESKVSQCIAQKTINFLSLFEKIDLNA